MAALDISIPPAIVCTISREGVGGSLRLYGHVVSREDARGKYRFNIRKSGPAGSATLNQSGQFSTTANVEAVVGSATIGVEQGADYDVQLVIEVGDQTYQCGGPSGAKT